jgi:hypothetical protein
MCYEDDLIFAFDERQRSLQYFTSSQTFSHFFLQLNGRLQTMQIFCGKCCFLCGIQPQQTKQENVSAYKIEIVG